MDNHVNFHGAHAVEADDEPKRCEGRHGGHKAILVLMKAPVNEASRFIHGGLNGYSSLRLPCAQWSMFSVAIMSRWNFFPQAPHVLNLDHLCAVV